MHAACTCITTDKDLSAGEIAKAQAGGGRRRKKKERDTGFVSTIELVSTCLLT